MSSIENLQIKDFRNIESAQVEFDRRVVMFNGKNAQGKTNFLEAIHLLSNLRSFRTRKLENLIRRGERQATLAAEVMEASGYTSLRLSFSRKERKTLVEGKSSELVSPVR